MFFLAEYHQIVHKKIQYARKTHGSQIAYYNIPPGDTFYDQQQSQTQQKNAGVGEIVINETPEERSEASLFFPPVTPYIKI